MMSYFNRNHHLSYGFFFLPLESVRNYNHSKFLVSQYYSFGTELALIYGVIIIIDYVSKIFLYDVEFIPYTSRIVKPRHNTTIYKCFVTNKLHMHLDIYEYRIIIFSNVYIFIY